MESPDQDSSAEAETPAVPQNKGGRWSCDLCKRMKVKCDRQGSSCSHCTAKNIECTVTRKQRKKRAVKRADYIATIEERIRQLEVFINAAGISELLENEKSVIDHIGGQTASSDHLSNLVAGREGAGQFIGSCSAFSLFSPRGIQWVLEKTRGCGGEKLAEALSSQIPPGGDLATGYWKSRPDSEQTPLPTKDIADAYVHAYFQLFNNVYPIFDEFTFRRLYEQQYSISPPTSVSWTASLNVVLAIGCVVIQKQLLGDGYLAKLTVKPIGDMPWMYLRNASSKFTELLFKTPELMTVQAVVGMAFIMQAVPDPQPANIISAAAARLSHAIGLHRRLNDFGMNDAEKRTRQNVFWCMYTMEMGESLRSGRPPAINDQDIAVALPQTTSTGYDHFRCSVTLSLIESRVYSELYSAKAATRSALNRLTRIGRLDAELIRWRDSLPNGYRPDSPLTCKLAEFAPVVMLHFSYYNTLAAVHRASIHHGAWISDPQDDSSPLADTHDEKLNPRVYLSSSICLDAARNTIRLLQQFDQTREEGLIFMANYYPLSATLTLFANVLQNPQGPEAFADLEMIGSVIESLSHSTSMQQQYDGVRSIFGEIHRISVRIVHNAQAAQLVELSQQMDANGTIEQYHFFDPSAAPSLPMGTSPQGTTLQQSHASSTLPPDGSSYYNEEGFDDFTPFGNDMSFLDFFNDINGPFAR